MLKKVHSFTVGFSVWVQRLEYEAHISLLRVYAIHCMPLGVVKNLT